MIRFSCIHCRAALRVPDELAGQAVACAGCKKQMLAPLADASAQLGATPQASEPADRTVAVVPRRQTVFCPGCGRKLRLPAALSHRPSRCPKCGQAIILVGDQIPTAQPASAEGVEQVAVVEKRPLARTRRRLWSAAFAMLLGAAAAPTAVATGQPLWGAALASLGAVLALWAILVALTRRGAGFSLALLSALVCGSGFGTATFMAGNVQALIQPVRTYIIAFLGGH